MIPFDTNITVRALVADDPKQPPTAERLPREATGFLRYLEEEVWPKAPEGQIGRRLSREEEDEILGYGPGGV